MKNKYKKRAGFSLMELLVVIGIISILATLGIVFFGSVRYEARDTKRKADLSQIGKFLTLSCILPIAGAGEYDLTDLAIELKVRYPQYDKFMKNVPKDPKTGTDQQSNYKYIVDSSGNKCALFANLENKDEPITITDITLPTPGRGTGVLQSQSIGFNGTNKFFQYSN